MRLLLDTHILLWVRMGDKRLKKPIRDLIQSAEFVYVSAASIWEIALKIRLGKIEIDLQDLSDTIEDAGFVALPISQHHAAAIASLPLHHHDPFDRMLIAQAFSEPLRLVTADPILPRYGNFVELVAT